MQQSLITNTSQAIRPEGQMDVWFECFRRRAIDVQRLLAHRRHIQHTPNSHRHVHRSMLKRKDAMARTINLRMQVLWHAKIRHDMERAPYVSAIVNLHSGCRCGGLARCSKVSAAGIRPKEIVGRKLFPRLWPVPYEFILLRNQERVESVPASVVLRLSTCYDTQY